MHSFTILTHTYTHTHTHTHTHTIHHTQHTPSTQICVREHRLRSPQPQRVHAQVEAIQTHIYTYLYVHTYINMHNYIHKLTNTHTHTHTHARTHTHAHLNFRHSLFNVLFEPARVQPTRICHLLYACVCV